MRGMYGGYVITFMDGNKLMKLDTKDGIRGMDIPVEITKEIDGTYSVFLKGIPIEIVSVWGCEWKRVK
jgi:hypothetical protein